jgi:Proto-chlorophyllide reductase 57 kD subunit
MKCSCGSEFQLGRIEEWDDGQSFIRYSCAGCDLGVGVEATSEEASPLFDCPMWTDEAQHCLERLPPYLETLVRKEVEDYVGQKHLTLISSGLITEARNQGTVAWHPDAEGRLARVPGPVRAMARVELERTALDRCMPEVTVALMEELKARYFGMAAQKS